MIGEDIGRHGGLFKVTDGLLAEFGPARVIDSPISEAAISGAGVGAALVGCAAGRRAPDLRLHHADDGPGGQPRRQVALHVGRPGVACRS